MTGRETFEQRMTKETTGDWRVTLIVVAQAVAAFVALLALLALTTRYPTFLLGFTFAQGLVVVSIALFVIVALFAQRGMVLERFAPGETVIREGDTGDEVYVVKAGTLDVSHRTADGSEARLRQLGPGEVFGELAVLGKTRRTATVRAVTAVEVYRLRPDTFGALYVSLPGVRNQVDQALAAREESSRPLP